MAYVSERLCAVTVINARAGPRARASLVNSATPERAGPVRFGRGPPP